MMNPAYARRKMKMQKFRATYLQNVAREVAAAQYCILLSTFGSRNSMYCTTTRIGRLLIPLHWGIGGCAQTSSTPLRSIMRP